jgi:hypothetical protein
MKYSIIEHRTIKDTSLTHKLSLMTVLEGKGNGHEMVIGIINSSGDLDMQT